MSVKRIADGKVLYKTYILTTDAYLEFIKEEAIREQNISKSNLP